MNKNILAGNWKILKGKVKEQWGELTDDEITSIEGSYDKLEGYLEKHYGYKKDRIEKEIETFCKNCDKEKTF